MEPATLMPWISLAIGLTNLGGWIWAILQSPSKNNADAITKLAKALLEHEQNTAKLISGIDRRTSTLEDALRHVPAREDMHKLELAMEKMAGALGVINAEMKAVKDIAVDTRDMLLKENV